MAAPLVPIIFDFSDDEDEKEKEDKKICTYQFVKGKRKGEMCGKKCVETYCSIHKTRKNIIVIKYKKSDINEYGLTVVQQSALDGALCIEKKISKPISVTTICVANFIRYICPISINFPSSILHNIIRDTHVRNAFEVRKGYDKSPRYIWESKLFNKCYDGVHSFERVKYGSIKTNPLSMKSNNSTLGYGDAFFLLKDDIKTRCTLTPGDSSAFSSDNVYTFDQLQEMLIRHPRVEEYFLSCYQSYERELLDGDNVPYIEVQIHGELLLSESIYKLVVSGKDENIRKSAEIFVEKNGCEVVFL